MRLESLELSSLSLLGAFGNGKLYLAWRVLWKTGV